jgi:predicted metallopeptidase
MTKVLHTLSRHGRLRGQSRQVKGAILEEAQETGVTPWNGAARRLSLHWSADTPLPVRLLGTPRRSRGAQPAHPPAPAWWVTGSADGPFDFCGHVRRLVADIAGRCDELRHIHVERLLIAVTPARTPQAHGLQARVTPLRFSGGALHRRRRGILYQVQRYVHGTTEFLYLLTFCLPRFLDQDFDGKFVTLFHELYHIGPAFDGDLRRHAGRYALHSHSQRAYDRHMAELARAYLATGPDPDLHAFLRLNFAQLAERHGAVAGVVVPRPKIVPVLPQSSVTVAPAPTAE